MIFSSTICCLFQKIAPRAGAVPAALIALILSSAIASAQTDTPKLLGKFNAWAAYVYGSNAERICYIMSEPQSTTPKNVTRGDAFFMVTHRPGKNIRNEISMRIGYIFSKTSEPFAQLGSDKFEMFTGVSEGGESQHWAWLEKPADEARMVSAMRRGSSMILKGTSSRGTLTSDTYPLSGVSAALDRIDEACK